MNYIYKINNLYVIIRLIMQSITFIDMGKDEGIIWNKGEAKG
jgi:hypothetical protein